MLRLGCITGVECLVQYLARSRYTAGFQFLGCQGPDAWVLQPLVDGSREATWSV